MSIAVEIYTAMSPSALSVLEARQLKEVRAAQSTLAAIRKAQKNQKRAAKKKAKE